MRRVLLIDDLRVLSAGPDKEYIRTCRTFDEGLEALKTEGPWDHLYLDHDLGETDPKKTGYEILCFLEENPGYLPGEISLVTANSSGAHKMRLALKSLTKLYGTETEMVVGPNHWRKQ